MRPIDTIVLKGSVDPLELFTCDVEFSNMALEPLEAQITKKEAKLRRVKARMARDRYKQLCFDG